MAAPTDGWTYSFFDGTNFGIGGCVMSNGDAIDRRNLTFSQAHGYEELPQPLKLEELSDKARTKLWSLLYDQVEASQYFLRRPSNPALFTAAWVLLGD